MKKIRSYNFPKIIQKQHEGKWIALSSDHTKIVATDNNLLVLGRKTKNMDVVYTRVLPSNMSFAPGHI